MISWEMGRDGNPEAGGEAGDDQSQPLDDAVEVLRAVWAATGQGSDDLADSFGPQKSCRSMESVGFDALASGDGDLRAAWRATLEREGKLSPGAGSVREIVLGQAES